MDPASNALTGDSRAVRRLGKNIDRYSGETIDIAAILAECAAAAGIHGWSIEAVPAAPKPSLLTLTRRAAGANTSEARFRIYISAGIHGDEPAGPLAVR